MTSECSKGFRYDSSEGCCTNDYLLPTVEKVLQGYRWRAGEKKIFDLGCGNGAFAHELSKLGYAVTGVDPSEEGIRFAKEAYPHLKLELGSAYDNLAERYGQFEVILSLEVIEHVYDPRRFVRCVEQLLKPGGLVILSTPYHGYLKNLVLALTNKWDNHFTALWDHGHIKFWSVKTVSILLNEVGLQIEKVYRVGRIPPLAKSMIVCARKAYKS
jgi:2-polyprenyl-6-hydroxyphenyl methylase/3-demethylubiquinone-9 3-methyltransferase